MALNMEIKTCIIAPIFDQLVVHSHSRLFFLLLLKWTSLFLFLFLEMKSLEHSDWRVSVQNETDTSI